MKEIRIRLNGVWRTGNTIPGQTLLDFLRNVLHSTEVKHGCGRGDCGACSVIMNGQLVDSCLVLALQADGAEILTAAGLGTPEHPDPIQRAFVQNGAIQCGFCTPGMVLAAKALLDEAPDPTEEQIRRGISGNLCRCTGYKKIFKAVRDAAEERAGRRPPTGGG
jgi:aerobic-type carbon monoxide dehydrogenase small subunit (CoxS/CutS family)